MALIQPDGIIRILRDTGLNNSFQHTRYFSDRASQTSYFVGQTHITLDNQSYSRPDRGWIRIQRKADDLYNCDYLMFQNTAYGNKWFYAFITQIDYVSNNTSQVYFEIDPIQSWFFEYDLGRCYVKRCHTATDNIGEHLEAEPVTFSDYKYDLIGNMYDDSSNYKWLVYAPFDFPVDTTNIDVDGINHRLKATLSMGDVCGLYQGLICTVFNSTTLLNAFTSTLPDDIASMIVAIVGVPAGFVQGEGGDPSRLSFQSAYSQTSDITPSFNDIDGYAPKNNKLYTHPYNSLFVSDGEGNENTYRWEYFNYHHSPVGETVRFRMVLACQTSPELIIIPYGYALDESDLNFSEKIVLKDFPHAAWIGNSFASYMANQGLTNAVNTVMGCLTGTLSAPVSHVGQGVTKTSQGLKPTDKYIEGNVMSPVLNAISAGARTGVELAQAVRKPNNAHGASGGGAMLAGGYKTVRAYRQFINRCDAVCIDDYFSTFGYAVNRMMQVPRHNREHWTYVETANCTVRGNLPAAVAGQIASIHNNGITYWVNGTEIGNYNLSNNTL